MRNKRREDPRKINEIRKIIERCRKKALPDDLTTFAQYSLVDGTKREHCKATFPVLANNPLRDLTKLLERKIREFNKNARTPDEMIISNPNLMQDLKGNRFYLWTLTLGVGDAAIKNAELSNARIAGEEQRKEELIRIGKDRKIKVRHESKKRALKKMLGVD